MIRALSIAWGAHYVHTLTKHLLPSAEDNGVSIDYFLLQSAPSRGLDAKKMRPRLILETLTARNEPILWIDADSVIEQPLTYLEESAWAEFDVGLFRHGKERDHSYIGAVQFWRPTETSIDALELWCESVHVFDDDKGDKSHSDKLMNASIVTAKAKVRDLPPEYCWRPKDKMEKRYGRLTPVIVPNAEVSECVPL